MSGTRQVEFTVGTPALDERGQPFVAPLGVELRDTGEFEMTGTSTRCSAASRC
jgi:hypothetical protein